MCGIVGLWNPGGDANEQTLRACALRMAERLKHRGPDADGAWVDAQAGVAMGHRRLSIIDLSPLGGQPMVSAGERYVIVYNGEIYNFEALREELESRGHQFRGHSDTEVLLAGCEQWGIQPAIERCVGMFAIAVWDRRERVLYLSRDRLGEKPLYMGQVGRAFVFCSELDALREVPGWKGRIDRDAVALQFMYQNVPAPHCIYEGIRKLAPGTVLRVQYDNGSWRETVSTYWSVQEASRAGAADPFAGSPGEAVDELENLVTESVRGQMISDVPLGAFLSGGIDSSVIVSLMQSVSNRPVKTFTIGFEDPAFNEAGHARQIAEHLGTEHTELFVDDEAVLGVVPRLPTTYDEPFSDPSQIPTLLLAEMTRQHVTVSLSGDGGDELFAGYISYQRAPAIWRKLSKLPPALRTTLSMVLRAIPKPAAEWLCAVAATIKPQPGSNVLDAPTKLGAYLAQPSLNEFYSQFMSRWKNAHAVVRGSTPAPLAFNTPELYPSHLSDPEAILSYYDLLTYLTDDILVKVDRAAMAVSLETRVPLLDHRVVEFALRVPVGLKVDGEKGKMPLRGLLERYVPREMFDRPKSGFAAPIGGWLRGPLRDWAEALLDERKLRDEGFLDPKPIRRIWQQHFHGSNNWDKHLWNVLMFQAWKEDRPHA